MQRTIVALSLLLIVFSGIASAAELTCDNFPPQSFSRVECERNLSQTRHSKELEERTKVTPRNLAPVAPNPNSPPSSAPAVPTQSGPPPTSAVDSSTAQELDAVIYFKSGTGSIRVNRVWEQGDNLCYESRGIQGCIPKKDASFHPSGSAAEGVISGEPLTRLGLTVEGATMLWYISRSSLQKESLISPELRFAVRNGSQKSLRFLVFKATFLDFSNSIFGTGSSSVSDLRSGYTSQTLFLRSDIGFVDSYGREALMKKDLNVELYLEFQGTEALIGRFPFRPTRIQ